jgi:mxaA protein
MIDPISGLKKVIKWCCLTVFILALIGCSPSLQEPVKRFEFQAPKPFGYVIGDEIHHRIIVETRRQLKLVSNSIPAKGRINRWLNLNQVSIISTKSAEGETTIIDLTYQVFYAPLEVKMFKIPGFNVKYLQNEQVIEQAIPEWHFTLSPLHELAIRKENDQVYTRPDAQPGLISNQAELNGLYLGLSVLITGGFYLAFLYGNLPNLTRRRLFKRAYRELSRLTQKDATAALAIVHHALNSRNQKPLFRHQLNEFYQQQPEFKVIANQLDWFFSFSNHYFFSGGNYCTDSDFLKIRELCQLCRKIERGSL